MTYLRDAGRIFYFQPGHESVPTFYNPYVLRIIYNAVRWTAPSTPGYEYKDHCPHVVSAVKFAELEAAGKTKSNTYITVKDLPAEGK